SPRRSAASGSSSSCSGRTSGATRGATRCSAISPSASAPRRSPPATSTPTRRTGAERIATGNIPAHAPRRTLLQDTLVAIRCRTSLDGCERERRGNREAVLRSPEEMVERFAGIDRAAAERTALLAERLTFDLTEELGYRYPDFSDRADPAIRQLAAICDHAFAEQYSASDTVLRGKARARLESELALIGRLGLAGFFLLHHEVLELARECALEVRGRDSPRMFLPPGRGRGSSVGSIVCYLT